MRINIRFPAALLCVFFLFGTTGCDDHQERYEDPPWLGGSSIETLEKRGNYTHFLALMDKAGYRDPITKQLFTLFVPDDEAFEEYFTSIGISSVEDMTDEEARNLFTLHVLRNPRSRYYLIYEYAWNEFQGPKGEYASLYHRKATPSTSIPYKELVRYDPRFAGQTLTIYTDNKYVPLFSQEWFGDYGGAEDGSDYTFMYPGSTWEEGYPGNLKGLNWHNAMVIPNPEIPDELEVRTSSGFIYFLDRVVPPIPSIEEYMIKNLDKYGLYYDLLQRFAQYGNSRTDEDEYVQYKKSYKQVFDLANERGPSQRLEVPPQNMWTAFLPNDEMLQEYLDRTVLRYYPSINEIPLVTLYYILQSQLSRNLVLRSKLENGYFNAFGDPTDLGPEDLLSAYMCSNGVVYTANKIIEPNVFVTVSGTLFFEKDYSTLLSVLNAADMLPAISNPDANVVLFASTNEALEAYGIRYNETGGYVEYRRELDGLWLPMFTQQLNQFAQDQICPGLLDLNGQESYAELRSGSHIRYGDGQASAAKNEALNQPAVVQEIIENDLNGYLIKVDRPIQSGIVMGQKLTCPSDNPSCILADPDFSEFADVCIALGLLDNNYLDIFTVTRIPLLKFLSASKYWTAFIPDNDAMEQARIDGIIPDGIPTSKEGKDSLENFVMYHFLKGNVIFDDGNGSGIFNTNYTYVDTVENEIVSATIEIFNQPGNLSVRDASGNIVAVDHNQANVLTQKGVMHKISSVLNYTEPAK
jgi:uncharacterized surface protein with fasciclin (FAS1) repeats